MFIELCEQCWLTFRQASVWMAEGFSFCAGKLGSWCCGFSQARGHLRPHRLALSSPLCPSAASIQRAHHLLSLTLYCKASFCCWCKVNCTSILVKCRGWKPRMLLVCGQILSVRIRGTESCLNGYYIKLKGESCFYFNGVLAAPGREKNCDSLIKSSSAWNGSLRERHHLSIQFLIRFIHIYI